VYYKILKNDNNDRVEVADPISNKGVYVFLFLNFFLKNKTSSEKLREKVGPNGRTPVLRACNAKK